MAVGERGGYLVGGLRAGVGEDQEEVDLWLGWEKISSWVA